MEDKEKSKAAKEELKREALRYPGKTSIDPGQNSFIDFLMLGFYQQESDLAIIEDVQNSFASFIARRRDFLPMFLADTLWTTFGIDEALGKKKKEFVRKKLKAYEAKDKELFKKENLGGQYRGKHGFFFTRIRKGDISHYIHELSHALDALLYKRNSPFPKDNPDLERQWQQNSVEFMEDLGKLVSKNNNLRKKYQFLIYADYEKAEWPDELKARTLEYQFLYPNTDLPIKNDDVIEFIRNAHTKFFRDTDAWVKDFIEEAGLTLISGFDFNFWLGEPTYFSEEDVSLINEARKNNLLVIDVFIQRALNVGSSIESVYENMLGRDFLPVTILYSAIRLNQMDLLQHVIKNNTFSISEKRLIKAVEYAARAANPEILAYLLNEVHDDKNRTILQQVIQSETLTANDKLEFLRAVNIKSGALNHADQSGLTPLHYASEQDNNLPVLKYLLQGKINQVNQVDSKGNTALHHAVINNATDNVKFLLRLKNEVSTHIPPEQWLEYLVDINAKNKDGKTVLHLAIEQHNPELVKELLQRPDINLNTKDNDHKTAFDYLSEEERDKYLWVQEQAREKSTELHLISEDSGKYLLVDAAIQKFLHHGDDAKTIYKKLSQQKYSDYTILQAAVRLGKMDLLRYVHQNTSLDRHDSRIVDALRFAAYGSNVEAFKYLIYDVGASLLVKDNLGRSIFFWQDDFTTEIKSVLTKFLQESSLFTAIDDKQLVDLNNLLKNADVNIIHPTYGSMLLYAMQRSNAEIIKKILDTSNVDVNIVFNHNNALLALLENKNLSFAELNKFFIKLLDAGFRLDKQDIDGANIVHQVVKSKYLSSDEKIELLQLVETKGAEFQELDNNDRLAIHKACRKDVNLPIVKYLIQKKDNNINAKDNLGLTPLHYAIMSNANETANYLLSLKKDFVSVTNQSPQFLTDINVQDVDGKTALHLAIEQRNYAIIKQLLQRPDLDDNLRDQNNKTAFEYLSSEEAEKLQNMWKFSVVSKTSATFFGQQKQDTKEGEEMKKPSLPKKFSA